MSKTPVVDSLKSKVEQLIEDNRRLRVENSKAEKQRERLKEDNRSLTEKLAALEKRLAVLELREGFVGGRQDNKMAMARINRLMREVDKCIALLEN